MNLETRRSRSRLDQRQKPADVGRRSFGFEIGRKFRQVIDEPLHPPLEAGKRIDQLPIPASPPRTTESAPPSIGCAGGTASRRAAAAHRSRSRLSCPTDGPSADIVHRVRDVNEVLEEISTPHLHRPGSRGPVRARCVIMFRQYIAHPAGGVGLLDGAASGHGRAAIEYADVVQSEKPALKYVVVRPRPCD